MPRAIALAPLALAPLALAPLGLAPLGLAPLGLAPLFLAQLLHGAPSLRAEEVPSDRVVAEAVQRACRILVGNQEIYAPDPPVGTLSEDELGSWQERETRRLGALRREAKGKAAEWPYEGVYRIRPDGRIPPGYRVGGSAIVCEALLEAPGLDSERRAAIDRSVTFMLDLIHGDAGMAPRPQTTYDVRCWGQAYALRFFLRALEAGFFRNEAMKARVETAIPHLIRCLKEGQLRDGGWNYAGGRVSPFMTGSVLLALFRAKRAGYEVDETLVKSALDALERARGPDMAYAYSGPIGARTIPMEGAGARSAVAELALWRGGRSSAENLRKAVDGFFTEANWKELLKRKSRQGTHQPPYGIAPYYFFYGHRYAALAAEHLPEAERPEYRKAMRRLLWRTIEDSGGWNDRVFPRTESYSTAMAVLALLAKDLPPAATW